MSKVLIDRELLDKVISLLAYNSKYPEDAEAYAVDELHAILAKPAADCPHGSSRQLIEFVEEWLSRQGDDHNYMTAKARAVLAEMLAPEVKK